MMDSDTDAQSKPHYHALTDTIIDTNTNTDSGLDQHTVADPDKDAVRYTDAFCDSDTKCNRHAQYATDGHFVGLCDRKSILERWWLSNNNTDRNPIINFDGIPYCYAHRNANTDGVTDPGNNAHCYENPNCDDDRDTDTDAHPHGDMVGTLTSDLTATATTTTTVTRWSTRTFTLTKSSSGSCSRSITQTNSQTASATLTESATATLTQPFSDSASQTRTLTPLPTWSDTVTSSVTRLMYPNCDIPVHNCQYAAVGNLHVQILWAVQCKIRTNDLALPIPLTTLSTP